MRSAFALIAGLLMFLPVAAKAAEPAPSADEILARHFQARGGVAALHAIRSLVFTKGAYSENATVETGDATMRLMRPFYKLVGEPTGHPDFLEGSDGSTWEWNADPAFTVRTVGAASEAGRHMTDVDGPYLDYAAKGSRVAFAGEAEIGGRATYHLRLTMMDGFVLDGFFDRKTWLFDAERMTAPIHAFGDQVASEQRFEDWRPVAGVLFPFRSRTVEIATGRELNAMQWSRIEANAEIPVAWFSPPVYVPAPPQALIEHLFAERDDVAAMRWTYRAFRRAYPSQDASVAGQIAAYQILKTGETASAIALLETGAADYPQSADTAFGLGRAYAAAGRSEDARREFRRALTLDPNHARAKKALAGLTAPQAKPQ